MTVERFQRIISTTALHFCIVFEKNVLGLVLYANSAWKLSVIIDESPSYTLTLYDACLISHKRCSIKPYSSFSIFS